MAYVLDFNTRKKEYLTVTLPNEKKTVLMIGTPTKKVLDEFKALNVDSADETDVSEIYQVCAKVMSFNKGGIKVKAKDLEDIFDLDDISAFFNAYSSYINGVTSAKN